MYIIGTANAKFDCSEHPNSVISIGQALNIQLLDVNFYGVGVELQLAAMSSPGNIVIKDWIFKDYTAQEWMQLTVTSGTSVNTTSFTLSGSTFQNSNVYTAASTRLNIFKNVFLILFIQVWSK